LLALLIICDLLGPYFGPLVTAGASSTNSSAGRLLDGLFVTDPSLGLLLVVLLCSHLASITPSFGPFSGICGNFCSDSSSGPYGDLYDSSCDGPSIGN